LITCQRRCAGEAQRRRYGRQTRLTSISGHRIGVLGFCLCLLIVAHRLAPAGMEKNIMVVLVFDFLIAVAVAIAFAAVAAFIVANVIAEVFKRS
jgi:hypothetical protein